jgi:hypothetical protein
MASARIGSRPHYVGDSESYQRCSIQFAFRVRQKENVMGRQTNLIADRAIAGGCFLFAYTGVEKVLE